MLAGSEEALAIIGDSAWSVEAWSFGAGEAKDIMNSLTPPTQQHDHYLQFSTIS